MGISGISPGFQGSPSQYFARKSRLGSYVLTMQSEVHSEACSYTCGCTATQMQPEGLGSMITPEFVLFVFGWRRGGLTRAWKGHLMRALWIISRKSAAVLHCIVASGILLVIVDVPGASVAGVESCVQLLSRSKQAG